MLAGAVRALARLLDGVYLAAGVAAAGFMIAIFAIVLASIGTRLVGVSFPGAADYAGYCMAAASFLALAHALRHGAHIRVTVLLQRLPGTTRRPVELTAVAIATFLAWYLAWYALKGVAISRMLGDVSQGQDATPLWIPQLVMAAGSVLLAVALSDHLVRRLVGAEGDLGSAGEA